MYDLEDGSIFVTIFLVDGCLPLLFNHKSNNWSIRKNTLSLLSLSLLCEYSEGNMWPLTSKTHRKWLVVCRWRERSRTVSRTNRWTEGETTRSDVWVLVRFSAASQPANGRITWSASQSGTTQHLSSGTLATHNLLQAELPGERMSL